MKKFKCIGLKEDKVISWARNFTIGKVYEGDIIEHSSEEDSLYLKGNDGLGWYTDITQFEEVSAVDEPWKQYRRTGLSEVRPYIAGEDLSNVSVSEEDNPEIDMGMIARNPKNHDDQWYVAREYFNENLEEVN